MVCVCVCVCVCVFDMRNTMYCKQYHRHRIIGRLVHVKKEEVLNRRGSRQEDVSLCIIKYICVCMFDMRNTMICKQHHRHHRGVCV